MSDLILITAHCPTEPQERMLEKCIDSVISLGYHVLLASHTHVPMHIQKKCNYYFYDYFNDITQDDDLLYYSNFVINENFVIHSKYFTKEFYGFAIYRMLTTAGIIAQNLGYKNMHHIEYDCVLNNRNLIDKHNKLLEEYDSVFYTKSGKSTDLILGAFKSFKLDSLPDLFKKYDKEKMREIMVSTPLLPLEAFTKRIFISGGNALFLKTADIMENGDFIQNESPLRLKHFTLYYDSRYNLINLFYKNLKDENDFLRIYTNKNKFQEVEVLPQQWVIRALCESGELENVMIISDNKIIYDKSFKDNDVELLKKNAYLITNEKNN